MGRRKKQKALQDICICIGSICISSGVPVMEQKVFPLSTDTLPDLKGWGTSLCWWGSIVWGEQDLMETADQTERKLQNWLFHRNI